MEPKRRYWMKADTEVSVATRPARQAVVRREGTDVTLLCYGPMARTAMDAAAAAAEEGWSVQVVDLRSLAPLDATTMVSLVGRTGRAIVVHEASMTLGMGAEVAPRLQEQAFYRLKAPVLRVTGFDAPYPPAKLEEYWLPD